MSESFEKKKGLFNKERSEPIPKEDVDTAIRVLRSYAAETIRGNPKALPLELRQTIQSLVVEPAVEIIITDEQGRYALVPRSSTDSNADAFGAGRLHLAGGFLKPNRKGYESVGPIGTAIRMAKEETGLDVVPISGPIATYQWTRTKEHPDGWPLSMAYVFKAVGGTPHPDLQWFDPDVVPEQNEWIKGHSGEIHRKIIAAYGEWRKNPATFKDLNSELPEEQPEE